LVAAAAVGSGYQLPPARQPPVAATVQVRVYVPGLSFVIVNELLLADVDTTL
jgi:hypothetical protein